MHCTYKVGIFDPKTNFVVTSERHPYKRFKMFRTASRLLETQDLSVGLRLSNLSTFVDIRRHLSTSFYPPPEIFSS